MVTKETISTKVDGIAKNILAAIANLEKRFQDDAVATTEIDAVATKMKDDLDILNQVLEWNVELEAKVAQFESTTKKKGNDTVGNRKTRLSLLGLL